MGPTLPETLIALTNSCHQVDSLLRQTGDPAGRAGGVTALLRELWPSAALYGCLLQTEGQSHAHARDGAGQPRPEWAEVLRQKLAGGSAGKRKAARPVKPPRGIKLSDHILAVEDITFEDRRWGALALALPAEAPPEMSASAQALLAVCADQLAVRLHGEAQTQALQALRAELAEQAWLSDVGELAGPVVHGVNNFLNVVSLHAAVLEQEVPEELRAELVEIRRQGSSVAAVVKHFQQYRQSLQPQLQPLDLNQLISDTLVELANAHAEPCSGLPIHLTLAPDLPHVLGSASDLKRLVIFLLRSACSAVLLAGGAVTVRTERATDCVRLRIEDTGPALAPELVRQMFELETQGRGTVSNLELAASKSLVRRLQGKITGENQPNGGMAVTVELPLS